MLSTYLFSQFDTKQFGRALGASLKLGVNPTKASNNVRGQIARTGGNATLVTFFVAPLKQSSSSRFSRRSSNLTQGRSFQMIKIGN